MGIYDNGIEGLIIRNNSGEVIYDDDFIITDKKVEELLDMVIPIDDHLFSIKKTVFYSFDFTKHTSIQEISKSELIDQLKRTLYILDDRGETDSRLLEKYGITELSINGFVGSTISIPQCVRQLRINNCSIDNIIVPNTIKKFKIYLTKWKNIEFQGNLEQLEIDRCDFRLPLTKRLIINIYKSCSLENIQPGTADLKIICPYGRDDIEISGIPRTIKNLEIDGMPKII